MVWDTPSPPNQVSFGLSFYAWQISGGVISFLLRHVQHMMTPVERQVMIVATRLKVV
jgi:hypothetical protein